MNTLATSRHIEELLGETCNDWVHKHDYMFWGELEISTPLDYQTVMEKIIAGVPDGILIGDVWQLVASYPPPRDGWIEGEIEDHDFRQLSEELR